VVAVKGSISAYAHQAVPQAVAYGECGQPPKPAYPDPPANLRKLALASADQIQPVIWRQDTRPPKATRLRP
jgi:hypothetical protein